MEHKGGRPKEKSDIGRVSDGYTDTQNVDNKGARPKEKSEAMHGWGGFRDRHNMDIKGARPKENSDTMRVGFSDKINLDNKRTRLIEKGDIRRDSAEYRDKHNMDSQLPSRSVLTETCQFVHHLSVRMCAVLDIVGASAEDRKLRQDCALSQEIILSLSRQLDKPTSRYIFGSTSEGTTTPGMNSDTDTLYADDIRAVDNISDAGDGHSLLMIRDQHTRPGYVKLQCVCNGRPQTVYTRDINRNKEDSDGEGRICLKHISNKGKGNIYGERNGPADTSVEANIDLVKSFRCFKIPKLYTEWIVRKRQYGWPSKHILDKMATMGCFVVGVGHPESKERNIEWRVSFSLQERELMFSMNIVQHKCYILLKLIKKDIIEPAIGKSISSYHLKTCTLYVIENTTAKLWKRCNLVQCVVLCLKVLLEWVLEVYCPNYFIEDENMFDRYIHRTKRDNIIQHLKHILSNGCEFLFKIKMDFIGDFLKRGKKNAEFEHYYRNAYFTIKSQTAIVLSRYKVNLCCRLNDSQCPLQTLEYLRTTYKYLLQTKCIHDHTEHRTQETLSFIIPFVHMQLAQSYASLAFSIDAFGIKSRLLLSYKYHLDQWRKCDKTSSKLLEATVLYKLEQYEPCIQILDQLEQELNQNSISMCRCNSFHPIHIENCQVKECYNLNVASILRRTSTCVLFLRSDLVIVPEAIQYEMYRSVGMIHGSKEEYFDLWMDLAVVDAVIYLLFMKYLVYANRNQFIHKHFALHKLESTLKQEQNLGHRETGYNLLGWIYLREGWTKHGITYLQKSWSIRPHHNAAKFHIMFYLFGRRN